MNKNSLITFMLIIFSNLLYSQQEYGGKSIISFDYLYKNNIPKISIKKENINIEKKEKNFYGKSVLVNIDLIKESKKISVKDGNVYIYKVNIDLGIGIQVFFDNFNLIDGCRLYVYNKDKSMELGAYTSGNNNSNRKFGIKPIFGKEIFIELFVPNYCNVNKINVNINNIVYMFKNPYKILDKNVNIDQCYINTSCSGIGDIDMETIKNEISSTSIIMGDVGDGYFYIATGTFINKIGNYNDYDYPYFLTAGHTCSCDYNRVSSSWIIGVNFISSYCNDVSQNSNYETQNFPTFFGSELLSCKNMAPYNNETSYDYALIRLNSITAKELSNSYEVCFSGWDIAEYSALYSNYYYAIAHPEGLSKKISYGSNIYSVDVDQNGSSLSGDTYWEIIYDYGATWDGASGSALYNSNNKIIGLLSGGNSYCLGTETIHLPDYYVKFSNSYDDGNFAQYLDPNGTGQTCVETYCFDNNGGGSGGGGGGSGYIDPPNVCVSWGGRGMSINGNEINSDVPCISFPIKLEYSCNSEYDRCETCYWRGVLSYDVLDWDDNFPSYIVNKDLCHISYPLSNYFRKTYKCYYYNYFISLYEVNENLSTISPEYSTYIKRQEESSAVYDGNVWPNGYMLTC